MDELKQNKEPLKVNPLDRANPLSKLLFCYLFSFFYKGCKRNLTEDDLYQYRKSHDSSQLGDELEIAWNKEKKKKKEPSLFKILMKVHGVELFFIYILSFIKDGVRLLQPLALSKLLYLFDQNLIEERKIEAYMYSAIIILLNVIHVLSSNHFFLTVVQVGMKMRIACCSLIYRKALKLSKSSLAETTVGQIVNIISNDVSRFDFTWNVHYLIFGPAEIIIGMILVYNDVGWIGLTGATFLLISIPIQSYFGKKASKYRLSTAIRTDERVRLMNEIISGIQVIKMYTWEKPFSLLVKAARLNEMKFIKYSSFVRVILVSCGIVLNRTAIFLCIIIYVLTGNVLTASFVYTTASFYRILNSVTMYFPEAVMQYSELIISIKRIQQFLLYEELEAEKLYIENGLGSFMKEKLNMTQVDKVPTKVPGICLKNLSTKWLESLPEYDLENISLQAKTEDLFAIVGTVGSGKTTLLHVILGELLPVEGTIDITGSVSYASQEPWLFGASVKQNILFGQQYNETRYREVIRVCALERDLTLFPHGDKTLIGERGVMLSGGQRARINMARAVYKEADIYLLDDPLSAVDTHVGKQLFDECIRGYLKNKCVILVTHQLQYLKNVDNIILLKDGQIQVSGSYEDLKNCDNNFTKILADIEEAEDEIVHKIHDKNDDIANDNDVQEVSKEEINTGDISWYIYKSYMRAGGHWYKIILLIIFFIFSQGLDSSAEYFVTFWVNIENVKQNTLVNLTGLVLSQNFSVNGSTDLFELDRKWWWIIFTTDYTLYYYIVLFISTIVFSTSASLFFYRWCIKVATAMHHLMFNNIVYSPMRFFNLNSSGRILNRFSRDIGILDETLPMIVLETLQLGLVMVAITVVLATLSVWIIIPTVIIFVIFYFLRIVFLEASRDIKRIESVARSPIFTHLTASLQGLTTIRAFKAENVLEKEFDNYQNLHSAAFVMFKIANRTFAFWLDSICVIYMALVIAFLLIIEHENFGGNFGLALTQAMGLTGEFQWLMRQWSELVNQMTSVERIQEYVDLVPEKDDQAKEVPKYWPEHGKIQFKDVCLRYSEDEPEVLKKLNFEILPKEKIGIVGRTGAGKSSLIQALFRLTYVEGSILIDGVDTKTVRLQTLRSNISIIPQEPVLFSGTLRKNLDPFDEHKDEVLWNALEDVELKQVALDSPEGLEARMAEGGANFSVGQRQLLCLARAILRNNKILVLDEATANVDPHTDSLIQETIRRKFKDCTVLTIAHRLHTVMDSDKVLVMDAGKAVEFDHPYTLLQNTSGIFYSLVDQTGKSLAKNLKSVAQESYYRDHNGRM